MTNEKIYVVTVQAFEQAEEGKVTPLETLEKKVNDVFYRGVRSELVKEVP